MLQFLLKGNGVRFCDRGKVLPQVTGEVQNHLLCFFRVLFAQVIDAHQGVIDKMRPHLQHGDTGLLSRVFLLLPDAVVHLVQEDKDKHDHGGYRRADHDHQQAVGEHLDQHAAQRDQQVYGKSCTLLFRQLFPSEEQGDAIHDHHGGRRDKEHKIPGSALIDIFAGNAVDLR